MEPETLLVLPQEPATFPCFWSDEHSLRPPVFFLQGRLKYHNPNYAKDFQVVCFLKYFPPKPHTGQLGPLLIWVAKAFDIFFKVFALVTNLDKINSLKFEHSGVLVFVTSQREFLQHFPIARREETFPKTLSACRFKLDSSNRTHSKANISVIAHYNIQDTHTIQVHK